MTTLHPHPTVPGWYPDPGDQGHDGRPQVLRWWNGRSWSASIRRWDGRTWVPRLPESLSRPEAVVPSTSAPADIAGVDFGDSTRGRTPPPQQTWVPPAAVHRVPDPPERSAPSKRRALLMLVGVLAICATAVTAYVLLRPNPATAYLEELRSAGLAGQYSSDANAVAMGEAACTRMRNGGDQAGSAGDEIAVKHLCPEFSDGFRVLREISVSGTFTLIDSSYYSSGISEYGALCEGDDGYSDISAGTTVVLKNGSGETLATTSLGSGVGDAFECTFHFTLPVKEGEDDYVVSVSDRGDMHYTFSELELNGLSLTLGD